MIYDWLRPRNRVALDHAPGAWGTKRVWRWSAPARAEREKAREKMVFDFALESYGYDDRPCPHCDDTFKLGSYHKHWAGCDGNPKNNAPPPTPPTPAMRDELLGIRARLERRTR